MKKAEVGPFSLFLIISFAGTLLFFITLIASGSDAASWIVMENSFDNTFTDHFRHIAFASDMKHFYFNTNDATFPPFAYLIYHVLWRMNPYTYGVSDWKIARDTTYNIVIFTALCLIVVLLYRYAADRIMTGYDTKQRTLFCLATILSAPVLAGAIERGNISLFTAILVMFALYLKDRSSAASREAALILIAMAAGIKLYPAIIGVIYLREKRFKEAIRLVIYGLIIFLVPFAFCGGWAALIRYLNILLFFEGQSYRSWTNIRNFLLCISDLCGVYDKAAYFVKYFKIAENVFLILCVIGVFRARRKWEAVLFSCLAMALYVPYSYRYTAVYMLIPLLFFFKEILDEKKTLWQDNVTAVLFALTFTIPVWGMISPLPADFWIFSPIYVLAVFSFVRIFRRSTPDA